MPSVDNAYYEQQRQNVRSASTRELATNAYARFLAQQRGSRERTDLRTDFRQGRNDYNTNINRFRTDLTQGYKQGYDPMAGQLAARGLMTGGVTSGVATQGINRYNQDYRRQLGRGNDDYRLALHRLTHGFRTDLGRSRVNSAQEMNQFDLNQANIRSDRQSALDTLRAQRAHEQAMTAQYLTALQPYIQ